jgi:recombination protein RecR
MYPKTLERLMDELAKLPGIGPKSAQRIALELVKRGPSAGKKLADAIITATASSRRCRVCFSLSDEELCPICQDPARDDSMICVVEGERDVMALERTHSFKGRYHVLGGVISPMDGIGPKELTIGSLLERLKDEAISEVLIATPATVEGETTASYLARLIEPSGVQVTRLATGVPVGGDLDYLDELTLQRAIEGRHKLR